eukprot:2216499-Rhodomonas_salina.1
MHSKIPILTPRETPDVSRNYMRSDTASSSTFGVRVSGFDFSRGSIGKGTDVRGKFEQADVGPV